MKEILEPDLDKYFNHLSERHFHNMIYRFENTIAHAGDKKYSITVQMQKKAISQLEIVGSKPFTTELRNQFLHFYKIDKRTVISELIPIIEELQKKYAEEKSAISQKRVKKFKKIIPFLNWIQRFSPKTQERILSGSFILVVIIYKAAVFLRFVKPIGINLRLVEPLATEKDKKKIVKDLIKYLNITRFITYANYRLNISEKDQEDVLESLGLSNIEKLIPINSKAENAINSMKKEAFLESIYRLLIENKFDEVFSLMAKYSINDTELTKDITLLKSSFNDNESRFYASGVISNEDYSVSKNRIKKGILLISDDISKIFPTDDIEVLSNSFKEKKQESIQIITETSKVFEKGHLFELINSNFQNVNNHLNKMELYVGIEDYTLDELKDLCQGRKKTFSSGMFLFVVVFDSIENAQFPSTPFTAMYGTDDNIMIHIKAIYTFNRLNGYSKLNFYENNMYESIVNEFNI